MVFFSSTSVTGSRIKGVQKWNNTTSSLAKIGGPIHPQGNPIGVAPEVPILVTRKDGRLGKFKEKLVVQYDFDTDAEGNDEIDGKELEVTTPIQRRIIHSTSPSPTQFSTTTNEFIRSPKPPQLPPRSSTRPSTLASNSTNLQPPMTSTSIDLMSAKLESVFYPHCCWNICKVLI
ncbi:hypothetical protein O181_082629 [Austropuccinia psidii MF-1]|uniref:Uncharacterized protein n=1 Tax=Austropuccinia psidii MF-1 TaxID=1389203 RepID=A0A9Q3FQ17_9BASI|nr:hypothetical protein [Austropuccinia psidii MF-1]